METRTVEIVAEACVFAENEIVKTRERKVREDRERSLEAEWSEYAKDIEWTQRMD